MKIRFRTSNLQRGQALLLLALAFVGLAAFIGLTVDAGILFAQIGHLRRAVDAASLGAAQQFRRGTTPAELESSAEEYLSLNSLSPATAEVYVCDLTGSYPANHDPNLCPPVGEPPRKFVRVVGYLPVQFAFLPIVGWDSLTIRAEAISEAAALDLVLAIDTSESMAYDAACDDGDDDDAWAEINLGGGAADGVADDCGGGQVGSFSDDYLRDPDNCNPVNECHPFEEVRAAANFLASRLNFPYDRMAVVTFDQSSPSPPPLELDTGTSQAAVTAAVNALTIFKLPGCAGYPPDPSGCTSTNTADGLIVSGNQFGLHGRDEAVWIVIVLSDGAANAGTDSGGNWICPGAAGAPTWLQPFCRDEVFEVGPGAYGTDAEDAAVEAALFVGCPDSLSPQPAGCPAPGQDAVIFTIGLGDLVTNSTACDPFYGGSCEPDQGEKLLRWIAGLGEDANPDNPYCAGAPVGTNCGNYYFSPTGSGLLPVFEDIASRIFTRITR